MELDVFIAELGPYFATKIDLTKQLENYFYYLGESRKFLGQSFHGGARLPEWLYGSSEKAERTHSMSDLDPGAGVSYVLQVHGAQLSCRVGVIQPTMKGLL